MTPARESSSPWPPRVAVAGFGISALGALMLILAPLGYRTGALELGTAFSMLRWGAYAGTAGAIVAALGLLLLVIRRRARGAPVALAAAGILIGVACYAYPALQLSRARGVPPIHDITTDTDDPPAFVSLLPARSQAPNKSEYGGAEVATQQQAAYPDIRPVVLNMPPDRAFDRALAAATALGWQVVEANAEAGRIEATDTTFWFGFKDDVVIRIRETEQGSRVDVRSMSRVGRGDVGANARRIRAFVERLVRDE